MLNKRSSDRRSEDHIAVFPILDSSGQYVGTDRRSGLDRRNIKYDKVAFNILSTLGS